MAPTKKANKYACKNCRIIRIVFPMVSLPRLKSKTPNPKHLVACSRKAFDFKSQSPTLNRVVQRYFFGAFIAKTNQGPPKPRRLQFIVIQVHMPGIERVLQKISIWIRQHNQAEIPQFDDWQKEF